MFKYEISADSPEELQEKMLELANQLIKPSERAVKSEPEYIDEGIEVSPGYVAKEVVAPPVVNPKVETLVQSAAKVTGDNRLPTARIGLDSRNIPWDERVHSSSKACNKDGTWRVKKGADPEFVKKIESDLKANTAVQQTISIAPPIPNAPAPTIPAVLPTFAPNTKMTPEGDYPPLTAQVNPVATPSVPLKYEEVPLQQSTRPAHTLGTFKNNLMTILATLINEKKITQEYIEELKNYFQVKEIWNVLGNELQIIELYNTFGDQLGFITKVE